MKNKTRWYKRKWSILSIALLAFSQRYENKRKHVVNLLFSVSGWKKFEFIWFARYATCGERIEQDPKQRETHWKIWSYTVYRKNYYWSIRAAQICFVCFILHSIVSSSFIISSFHRFIVSSFRHFSVVVCCFVLLALWMNLHN